MSRVVLASASPRRKELLGLILADFAVAPAEIDETHIPGESPEEFARNCARQKAEVVAARWPAESVIVGADTIVVWQGKIFGKPSDAADARLMLRRLSGTNHEVIGGVALCPGQGTARRVISVATKVMMREITEEEISAYIAGGEPMDKAGAYAIQGEARKFVTGCDGDYYNVVGFPLARVRELLQEAGVTGLRAVAPREFAARRSGG